MEYLSLFVLVGIGFVGVGLWMLSLEARQLRLARLLGEIDRERVTARRLLAYHGQVVGLVRGVLAGRRLTDEQKEQLGSAAQDEALRN